MADATSSDLLQSSSASETLAPSTPFHEQMRIELACEQRLHYLACKARAKGIFSKVPPCHIKARRVVHEITKFLELKNRGFQIEPDYSLVYNALRDLSNVKVEEFHSKPGYDHVMGALKKEFDNYSVLALQRGFKERGEVYQLIAHYPRVGHFLRKINIIRPYRYEGVTQNLKGCSHQDNGQMWIPNEYEKPVVTDVPPSEPRKCAQCEERVCYEALINFHHMTRILDEEPTGTSIDATISPFKFEKSFTEVVRSNCDIESGRLKERMFQMRLRQQMLTAKINIYPEKSYGEQLDNVLKEINSIAEKVQEDDVKTKLRRPYDAEKAKNRAEKLSPSKDAKFLKDEKNRDDSENRKDTLKRGTDDLEPSSSSYVPKRLRR
uniref:Uncharacterized protein n=2 Tax=Caenorhabditis tropicalis TaxID=1561998 RepID=A0A1I7TRW6_9PELO